MTNAMHVSRRNFLAGALAAGASTAVLDPLSAAAAPSPAGPPQPQDFPRKIKLGLIGCGGRGPWLADLFRKHGGYADPRRGRLLPRRPRRRATNCASTRRGDSRASGLQAPAR